MPQTASQARSPHDAERNAAKLRGLRAARDRYQDLSAELLRQNRALELRFQSLREARDVRDAKIESLRKAEYYRQSALADRDDRIEALSQEVERLRQARDERDAAIWQLRERVRRTEELEQEGAKLQEQLRTSRQELKRIKNSRSWKYTRTLRKLNKTDD